MKFILVFVGSGLGGVVRYGISVCFSSTLQSKFPWATLTANCIAAFLVGLFYAIATQKDWLDKNYLILLTVGLCGGLSTFSTFSHESLKLFQTQQYGMAVLYIFLSVVTSIGLSYAGSRIL